MTTLSLYEIVFDVHSPSHYRARSWPTITISYSGEEYWVLIDSEQRWCEEHPSLVAAAWRLRRLADAALHDIREQN